ncbi:MAG: lectin-like protein, partial [Limisphaerales bacterium]
RNAQVFVRGVLLISAGLQLILSPLDAAPLSPPIRNPSNGHTYILLAKATWSESQAEAVSMGGNLATIRNQAEQDWLFQTFGNYGGVNRLLWIGLNDAAVEGHFVWASGEVVNFTHWRNGEPNNANGNECFVALFDPTHSEAGQWNDWSNRDTSPLGRPMNGVVEIIPTLPHLPPAAPYSFTTIIGAPGDRGFLDGTNTNAGLSGVGIAAEPWGNLYIADSSNHSIRRAARVGTNWVVTTLAGTTNAGWSNGIGTNASFENPWGIAVDSAQNIYVAGRGDQMIRKIVMQGTNAVVTTLAGAPGVPGFANGSGAAARFHNPNGVAVDKSGNVYVGDSVNNRIRHVTPSGMVTTIAGGSQGYADGWGGSARFYYPHGLKVDQAGNIYVADTYNHLIRKITPIGTNWLVSTIAGNYRTNSLGEPLGGYADGANHTAEFNRPYDIALDDYGNLFVSDCYSNRTIRKITPVGTNWVVTTIGGAPGIRGMSDGSGTGAQFWGLYSGVAVDAKGSLYVMDTATIRMATPNPQIARDGNQVIVGWPASLYRLEQSTTLSPGSSWSPVSNWMLINRALYATNAIVDNAGFLRLR